MKSSSRLSKSVRPIDLNHIGILYDDEREALRFYRDLLGFTMTDYASVPRAMFMRLNNEHHSLSLFPREGGQDAGIWLGEHEAWEMETYEHLLFSLELLSKKKIEPVLMGRRMPGSNYTIYFRDSEGNLIELAYGLETVGWNGKPKPFQLWAELERIGTLPSKITADSLETDELMKKFDGKKLTWTASELAKSNGKKYDASREIGRIPFKISRLSYYSISCKNIATMASFYSSFLGLDVKYKSKTRVALAAPGGNYPDLVLELNAKGSNSLSKICFEMRSYSELVDCSEFLKRAGVEIEFEGYRHTGDAIEEFCIDFEDPSGNQLRFSFSPKLRGLKVQSKIPDRRLALKPAFA